MNPVERSVEDILRRFASVAREEIRREYIAASCVPATWVTVEVLRRLGVTAEPREVVASVGNGTYVALWQRYGPPKTRELLDHWTNDLGADIIGIGHDRLDGGIGGHLIATISDELVVDASLDQAASLLKGAEIPPVVIFPIDPRLLRKGIIRYVSSELFIEYVDRPTITDYRASPDWGSTPEALGAVERIIQRIANWPVPRDTHSSNE